MNNIEKFKEFFISIIEDLTSGDIPIKELKTTISQFEIDKLAIFFVTERDNGNRQCYGHYCICDINSTHNSIAICDYFKIAKYLKDNYNLDLELEWDWFLNS